MFFMRMKLNFDRCISLVRENRPKGEIKIECRRDGLKCVKQRDGNESQIPVRGVQGRAEG